MHIHFLKKFGLTCFGMCFSFLLVLLGYELTSIFRKTEIFQVRKPNMRYPACNTDFSPWCHLDFGYDDWEIAFHHTRRAPFGEELVWNMIFYQVPFSRVIWGVISYLNLLCGITKKVAFTFKNLSAYSSEPCAQRKRSENNNVIIIW